ncbi:MAG: guanylate kinase [Betaproteobacteria bacterium]|jgi:guanylate kinase|nr:guanylate kinase [Betaproteobacteria bacterium]
MSGLLFVVTAPSGAGKSSLIRAALAEEPAIRLSVSYTTRAPRAGEQDGREYHFVDAPTFEAMVERGEFLECAEVHGNRYGTSQKVIDDTLARDEDLLLEIDWQGAAQVRRLYSGCVTIFILPPSVDELGRRMRTRGLDSEAVIARRLANAHEEMRHAPEFEYVIINNDFETARRELLGVLRAERVRTARQLTRHPRLFDN